MAQHGVPECAVHGPSLRDDVINDDLADPHVDRRDDKSAEVALPPAVRFRDGESAAIVVEQRRDSGRDAQRQRRPFDAQRRHGFRPRRRARRASTTGVVHDEIGGHPRRILHGVDREERVADAAVSR